MLKNFIDMLNMKPDSFFTMIFPTITAMIGGIIKIINTAVNQPRPGKIFQLYCKRETDNFYVAILFWESAGMIAGCFGAAIICMVIESVCYQNGCIFKWETELLSIISVEISCVVSIIMVKRQRVRERLLGDEKGRKIIACSIIFINTGIMFGMLNEKVISYVFIFFYIVYEIKGLSYFGGRYIKYDFSFMRIYLKNGEKIICEQIEKAKRKKDFIILEERDENIVLLYDRIERVEYYGPPKIILTESVSKKTEKK